jgi:hypothetical protein
VNRNKHEFSLIPDPSALAPVFLSGRYRWLLRVGPPLNKRADANWRLQSEGPEVVTLPGPVAALVAPFWLPVPRSLLLFYSS